MEIWLMIVGRVLVGIGFGVLSVRWIPQIANPLADFLVLSSGAHLDYFLFADHSPGISISTVRK